ncbi:heparinase II/III family protein [Halalkalibacter sp. APA_J-10(15)]|uniref:heparinase II/III family protein n=1 Tax=Halalkalibacter sp. APA_J-10(15) TaxID=2933805 RepID=UPI001FF28CC4|nr:heparinase II/III family protein [Halalkalibacter sp. APA_J-10(15)]MCK0472963.1 heparinase II/III-family protein [Halalkalibacter sp. APA_J-10(15)]
MKYEEMMSKLHSYAPIENWFSSHEGKERFFQQIQIEKTYQTILEEVKMETVRLRSSEIPDLPYSLFKLFSQTGSRKEYEAAYFERRRRLNTFALMVLIEPKNEENLANLHEIIWYICNEYSWCLPAHMSNDDESSRRIQEDKPEMREIDLFASETAFALTEIAVLLEPSLDPLIRKRIKEEVRRRVLQPFYYYSYHWEQADHNWAAVCAGSIGAVAIYSHGDDHEFATILTKVMKAMESYLSGFYDDGACLEGYGYWQYGFGFYVYFADLLKKKTAGQIDLLQSEKVHQIALFQQKAFLTGNRTVRFSDSVATGNVWLGLTHYLNQRFSDVDIPKKEWGAKYTDDHCSRWAPAIREILWLQADVKGKPWLPQSYYLEKTQWFVSRYEVNEELYAFATKGGHNDEPHNHNDVGQFILACDEDIFLTDLGSGEYTKRYFSKERYSYLCNGSHGHSVPIVNGHHQKAGSPYRTSSFHVVENEQCDEVGMEYADAYGLDYVRQLERSFKWEKTYSPALIIEDMYSADRPVSFVSRFMTQIQKIKKVVGAVLLVGNEQCLRITYDEQLIQVQENVLTFSNHFGEEEQVVALDFTVRRPMDEAHIHFECRFEKKG